MSGGRHTVPVDVHLLAVREGDQGPEVLLSRRAGEVYASGLWHLPSGHVDGPFEDAVTALVRETCEETGLVVDPADVRAAVTVHHRAPAGGARLGILFEVRRWAGTPEIREPDVCDAMDWFAFDALPEPMVAYCRAGLDAYRAGAGVALHFQEPGDPIGYDPAIDRLQLVYAPGTERPQPSSAVRDFTERAVGRITDWSDVSWVRDGSQVWRAVNREGGVWFVKVHQNARFHGRETAALRGWVPGLGGAGPRLVAADPGLRAVVVTGVEGWPLHGRPLSSAEERCVFRSIGALAARIHTSPLSSPAAPRAAPGGPFAKLERHLEATRPHLEPGDEEYVRAVAERGRLLEPLPLVVTHGDLQLRNLLLADDGSLRVLDFERSEPQPVVRDMVRLLASFDGRDDLACAFFDGYGRPLTVLEQAHLVTAAVLDAVSGIGYGHAAGDPELVERGRRTLFRSRAGTLLPPPSRPAQAAPHGPRSRRPAVAPPVRPATAADAGEITRLRSAYVLSEPLDEAWLALCCDQLAGRLGPEGDARAYVVDAPTGELAACALGLVHPVLPGPRYPEGLAARIHVVATEPAYRRRGYARAVVSELLDHLERDGVTLFELHASEEAAPLYEQLGFASSAALMRLTRLSPAPGEETV